MTEHRVEPGSDDPSQPRVNGADGPSLRSLRRRHKVSLRKVAGDAGMSHGHLSKVERGEVGRPVTPKVLDAYANATGVPLHTLQGGDGDDGQLGQLSPVERSHFHSVVGGLAVGGSLTETMGRTLDSRGRLSQSEDVDGEVQQLSRVAELLERLDGAMPGRVAWIVLRWLVDLLDQHEKSQVYAHLPAVAVSDPARIELYAVASRLARRAGQAAVDMSSHEAARTHFTVSLYAAVAADDADLRGLALAEIASQYHRLGQHDDCLAVARLGQVDERISEPVGSLLDQLKKQAAHAKRQPVSAAPQAVDEPTATATQQTGSRRRLRD